MSFLVQRHFKNLMFKDFRFQDAEYFARLELVDLEHTSSDEFEDITPNAFHSEADAQAFCDLFQQEFNVMLEVRPYTSRDGRSFWDVVAKAYFLKAWELQNGERLPKGEMYYCFEDAEPKVWHRERRVMQTAKEIVRDYFHKGEDGFLVYQEDY